MLKSDTFTQPMRKKFEFRYTYTAYEEIVKFRSSKRHLSWSRFLWKCWNCIHLSGLYEKYRNWVHLRSLWWKSKNCVLEETSLLIPLFWKIRKALLVDSITLMSCGSGSQI